MDPLSAALTIGNQLITRMWPDPAEQAKAQLALLELAQRGELGQLEVNKAEATNTSVFVAGWRPFIGWVCGAAFAYKFVLAPAVAFALTATGHPIDLPTLDFTEMSTVLFGMLGIGGLRTLEKIKGVA